MFSILNMILHIGLIMLVSTKNDIIIKIPNKQTNDVVIISL